MHLFYTKYSSINIFTDISLKTYCYKNTDINFYLEYYLCTMPKLCFNVTIDEDYMIFK